MSNDTQAALEAQLARYQDDRKQLEDGIASIQKNIAEITANLSANRGALQYNEVLTIAVRKQLADLAVGAA